ncbi:MAG: DUF1997 domain-containing protein [Cyanobacteria bacterium J06623_7]
MQSNSIDRPQNILEISSDSMQLAYTDSAEQQQAFIFKVSFQGRMDMYSDVDTVAEYLNAHEGWFCRCAQPMQVEPLADNGYILTVGKFGSFGYEVEPKIGVVLNPPINRVYWMHTIPIPDCDEGYEVNYRAKMELQEVDGASLPVSKGLFNKQSTVPDRITKVNWNLDLKVKVELPQFVSKLSSNLIQATGDRLLAQIVRQVSPRLTYKVQQDFHDSYSLAMPPKSSRQLHRVEDAQQCAA